MVWWVLEAKAQTLGVKTVTLVSFFFAVKPRRAEEVDE